MPPTVTFYEHVVVGEGKPIATIVLGTRMSWPLAKKLML